MKYTEIVLPYRTERGVLAFGAQSKAAFCFAGGNVAYLSDSGGDLSDLGNFKKFEKDIKEFQKKMKMEPTRAKARGSMPCRQAGFGGILSPPLVSLAGECMNPWIIACDLHPEYISTKYAKEKAMFGLFGLEPGALSLEPIQHHEAHVASCIADNNIKGKVIGIAFDGTGFGTDGNIWGGEFFTGDVKGFKRAAHLKYIPMPGGEACIREPWRMAFSYLYNIYGKERDWPRSESSAFPRTFRPRSPRSESSAFPRTFRPRSPRPPLSVARLRNDILSQMIDKKINSPLTSSMGRLFDGVSSLIGVCDFAKFEGEAAVKLEKIVLASSHKLQATSKYKFKYFNDGKMIAIDWGPVIRDIVKDMKSGIEKSKISWKFHNAVCDMIKDVCNMLRKKYKIKKVCMSGGVFQNKYLSGRIGTILEKEGFDVYAHKNVPTHDGGIALGQAVLAYRGRF